MGKKSSAKSQTRPAVSPAPPREPARPFNPLLIVALVAAIAVVGAFAYMRTPGQPDQASAALSSPAAAISQAVAEAPAIALTPHPQSNLPPLPFDPMPPARPMEIVRAAYTWAAEHPEIATYVPCYCGCEHSGHRGSEDCFVARRNDKGDVTEWEPHGMT